MENKENKPTEKVSLQATTPGMLDISKSDWRLIKRGYIRMAKAQGINQAKLLLQVGFHDETYEAWVERTKFGYVINNPMILSIIKEIRNTKRPSIASQVDIMSSEAYAVWIKLWMSPVANTEEGLKIVHRYASPNAVYVKNSSLSRIDAPNSSFISDTHANVMRAVKDRAAVEAVYPPFSVFHKPSFWPWKHIICGDEMELIEEANRHRSHVLLKGNLQLPEVMRAVKSVLEKVHNHVIIIDNNLDKGGETST